MCLEMSWERGVTEDVMIKATKTRMAVQHPRPPPPTHTFMCTEKPQHLRGVQHSDLPPRVGSGQVWENMGLSKSAFRGGQDGRADTIDPAARP